MKTRILNLWAWAHTHEGKKILRFTAVSGISTIVSNVVLFIVYQSGLIPYEVWATIFGNLVATFPSYRLNRSWTWGKRGKSHFRKEIVPFWTMSLLGISFSIVGAFAAKWFIHHNDFPKLVNSAILVFANLLSFAIFWVLKLKVFNNIFHVNELEEMDEHLTEEEQAAQAAANETGTPTL